MRRLALGPWFLAPSLWVSVLLLAGCSADTPNPSPAEVPISEPVSSAKGGDLLPAAWASTTWVSVVDPTLDDFAGVPLLVEGRFLSGYTCGFELMQDGSLVREITGDVSSTACAAMWDGRDDAGTLVGPGTFDVSITLLPQSDTAPLLDVQQSLDVVRLGFNSVQLEAVEGSRVGVVYRAAGGIRGGFVSVPSDSIPFRMSETWDDQNERLPLLAPWDDLTSPPLNDSMEGGIERENLNLPTAFVAGSLVRYSATLADMGTVSSAYEFRAVSEGRNYLENVSADDALVLSDEVSSVPAVGRYDEQVVWQFQGRAPGGEWFDIPGQLTTTHRMYGLVREPVFDYSDVRHQPWVDVLDVVAGWVDGTSADGDEVASRIVEGVYFELDLTYDRNRGASFYTSYPGRGWPGAHFDLSRFQERTNGDIINCSDAGSIVSTYANMVGLDFRYHILRHGSASHFDLNYIQAIGWDEFTETPFFSGRGGFSYHAVVGPADGRFFDATLALDGDDMPEALPSELLLAQGMTSEAYLGALSTEAPAITIRVDEQVRIR